MPPQHRRLIALLLLFLAGAWLHGYVLPPLEGGDEWLQLAYIEHLRTTGTLPDRADTDGPIRQQAGQPPLTYAVGALPAWLSRLPPLDTKAMWDALQRDSNNWFAPPDPFNRVDNNNVFYLSNAPANDPQTRRHNRAARLIAPFWGVVGILATYAAAWEALRHSGQALAAAALFALTPTLLHISAFPNTDGGAAALGAVVTWLAMRAARGKLNAWWGLGAGLALGLGGLAKVSVLLTGLGLAVGLWLGTRGHLRAFFRYGVLAAPPFLLTFGLWALWGWQAYGDPFGTATHRFEGQYFDPPLGGVAVLARLPEVYLSYWGKFGSTVYLHPATYTALTLALLLAVAVGAWRSRPSRLWAVPWAVLLLCMAGLWYWLATINFITGRLLFPAAAAIAILVVSGLRAAFWRGVVVGVVGVTGLVIAPAVIATAYRPPPASAPPPNLTETIIDYDEAIRLTGWQAAPILPANGELYPVTLCWEVLAEPARPAAYSLKIVRDGIAAGERTSVHGLGRYDWQLWEPGHRFCERVDVPVQDAAPGAYDLLLVLLDAQTGAVDWQATTTGGTPVAFPVLGRALAE